MQPATFWKGRVKLFEYGVSVERSKDPKIAN